MSLRNALLIGCILGVSIIDRIVKVYALSHIGEGAFIMTEKFAGVVSLEGSVGIVAALFACLLITAHARAEMKHGRTVFFHGAILLGAISNLFDRIAYGAVIDWLAIGPFTVVNGSDLLIIGGVLGLCAREWRKI